MIITKLAGLNCKLQIHIAKEKQRKGARRAEGPDLSPKGKNSQVEWTNKM